MAIEKEQVIGKLKAEGIDETLGDGISFETEEDLNKWVGKAKTFMDKPKSLREYTTEELENELKNPTPTAKGLQALADKIRTETRKKLEEKDKSKDPPEKPKELPEEIKAKLAEIDQLKAEFEASKKENEQTKKEKSFEELFDLNSKGLEAEDKKYVRATLKIDSSEEDIKKAVATYKSLMAKRGFKDFGSGDPSHKSKDVTDKDLDNSIKRILENNKKK